MSRPSLKRSLSVLVTPLRSTPLHGLGGKPDMAALFVTDPDKAPVADAKMAALVAGRNLYTG